LRRDRRDRHGTRRLRAGRWSAGPAILGARLAREPGRVELTLVVEAQGAYLLQAGIEHDEPAAVLVDAQHLPRRLGADEHVSRTVHEKRGRVRRLRAIEDLALPGGRDPVHEALLARAGVEHA